MSVAVEEEEPRILLKVDEKNEEKDIIKMMVEKLFIIKSLDHGSNTLQGKNS